MENERNQLQKLQEEVEEMAVAQRDKVDEWSNKLQGVELQADLLEERGKVFFKSKEKKQWIGRRMKVLGGILAGLVVVVVIVAVVVSLPNGNRSSTEETPQDTTIAFTTVGPGRTVG